MKTFKPIVGCLLVIMLFACSVEAQGPLRRFGQALREHQPVRTAIQSRPIATAIKTIVQDKPIRSAMKHSYQSVAQSKSYGSSGTSVSYGSTGTSYTYSTVVTSVSYGSTGSKPVQATCPCGPKCQCDVGGTPCPCPKITAACPDCPITGTTPPVLPDILPDVPKAVGATMDGQFEYSSTEASDNFHRAVTTAIIEARKEGKISRVNALAVRGAMHLPSFKEKVKAEVIKEGKRTGQIPVNATPEEVGKIDFSKVDWIGLIKALLPVILTFL